MHRIIFIATLALAAIPALARDSGQWGSQPTAIRQWFLALMQPDHPRVSCCGEADAYEADSFEVEGNHYVAVITAHRAVSNIPFGTRIPVPNHKMKWDSGNPTGHGIIFVGTQGQVFCYVTPGGI
jgi:hypothetical protein